MSDWALPILSSNYPDFLTYLKARDADAATLFITTPTNPAEGFIRFVRVSNLFQEYLSGVWTTKLLSLAGGGTGAANASDARANLGLGSMALQNSSGVAITGGSISGIAFAASAIASGNLDSARMPLGGNWTLTSLLAVLGHAFHVKALGAGYRIGAGSTLTDTDFIFECSGGTVPLPDATTITGRIYIVKRSGSTVVLDPFGAQTISINGSFVATYAGLGNNQSIILQSTGSGWVALTMGGNSMRDNQFVTVTINTGSAIENQALATQVNDVRKATIFFLSGLIRGSSLGFTTVQIYFSDAAGNEITSGPATHIRAVHPFGDSNSPATIFKFIIEERE